jgi:arginase
MERSGSGDGAADRPCFAILDAPSILGLRPTGVELLPRALRDAGLVQSLSARDAGMVRPPPYDGTRDPTTHVLNARGIRDFSIRLADAISGVIKHHDFALVLGGDCSIVIGAELALRRSGRCGLFFIDGHADFYSPEASPTGEVADMDLAIVTGRGPRILTDIEGLRPLVLEEDIVLFAYRDADESRRLGSPDVRETSIHAVDLDTVRARGIERAASDALRALGDLRFWIHLDVDVLDDAIMPAVDYRMKGGLRYDELSALLRALVASRRAVGMTVAIFNPKLDADGTIASELVRCLVRSLR